MNKLTPDEHRIMVDAIHDSATVIHKGRRMNERIRQLADEADKWAQTMTWSSDPKYGDRPFSDLFNEKFAQLIVQECIDTVSDCSVEYCTRPQIVNEIKQHFGVEE